ncbi:unnamed protein product [Adineta steineri]|uniref:Uncharacterized protein n=1 Tax=Adineta steineri TaxID=433720 RepID=A0A815PRL9_9BILA|nr:unnamed protein product [Adineta steineri]CAF1631102.1 unnamed protein product [Adineta steineri]
MASTTSSPLVVIVSGGGPVGLTFSLNIAAMMGKHVKIIIYEGRWFVDEHGITRWQGEEQGNIRRDQVVTLQDHVIEQMPTFIQEGLFQKINERVWPTSRNIPIREVEDRLLDLIQPFVQNSQVELIPEQLNEQSRHLIEGDFDVLVGADGSNSFVRRYCNIQMISEGIEYACGVAYNIPEDVPPLDGPLHQALNCILTISQTRYLLNSSASRRGYLNIRLIQNEYEELRECLQPFQNRNASLNLLDYDKCPCSPVWSIVRQGLDFFKISAKYVIRVVPIEINVRHASIVVRELRFEINKTQPTALASNNLTSATENVSGSEKKQFKTMLAFLAGDAAMNVHFWPGRGMNSGMKAAMTLARNIFRTCTSTISPYSIEVRTPLRFLDFLDYEGFMARLRAREQQGRSLRILMDPIDTSVGGAYTYPHLQPCYKTYTKNLYEKLKETRLRLDQRSDWPHQTKSVTDEELQSAYKRINPNAVAQLSLANPWPTREMSGTEVLVEDSFPFKQEQFLPVPTIGEVTLDRPPSKIIQHHFLILCITGDNMSENTKKIIDSIKTSPKFTNPSTTAHELHVVSTIEEAQEWIAKNNERLGKQGILFKVITTWSLNKEKTAVDVIRAVRAGASHIPVLILTDKSEETQSALDFPNVITTYEVYEVNAFVGINQETQWNPGCPVSPKKNSPYTSDSSQSNHSTISTATMSKNPITTNQISTQSQIKQKEIQTKKNKFQQFGITVAGRNGNGHKLNQLYNPEGIFIDNDKSIYIADFFNHRIVKWKLNSNTGQVIAGGNGKGSENNQLDCPTNIIYDKRKDSFIISDWENKRVIRHFDQNQTNPQIIISHTNCFGLTMDKNGFIYVSDRGNHEVRRWKQGDKKGELVAGGNGEGNHLNQLDHPTYIFIDEDYSLYISDERNHRVMKWKKDAKEGIIVAGGNGQGNSLRQLSCPEGVIVDHLGQIYVADSGNDRIMRWCEGDEEGEIVVGGNGWGNQSNQLRCPTGLLFDNEENLYVVDSQNHRVQKYEKL